MDGERERERETRPRTLALGKPGVWRSCKELCTTSERVPACTLHTHTLSSTALSSLFPNPETRHARHPRHLHPLPGLQPARAGGDAQPGCPVARGGRAPGRGAGLGYRCVDSLRGTGAPQLGWEEGCLLPARPPSRHEGQAGRGPVGAVPRVGGGVFLGGVRVRTTCAPRRCGPLHHHPPLIFRPLLSSLSLLLHPQAAVTPATTRTPPRLKKPSAGRRNPKSTGSPRSSGRGSRRCPTRPRSSFSPLSSWASPSRPGTWTWRRGGGEMDEERRERVCAERTCGGRVQVEVL